MKPLAYHDTMSTATNLSLQDIESRADELCRSISGERFDDWYQERQHRRNIENGTPYFNGSDYVPDPRRHSPSKLLQCHRKIAYRQCNAPSEKSDPDGIFWFGTRFEEDIAFPFLERAVTGPDTYVCNTMWIEHTVETEIGELFLKGATDPVIVDKDANPILPTEIKTKSSVNSLTSPNRHHKAQLHAYMVALSAEYDLHLSKGILIYGSRESLDIKTFSVEFDPSFWEDVVLQWAEEHTEYRVNGDLPPRDPEYNWECDFCDYRERCGKGDVNYRDIGDSGLLPGYADYPRESIEEYLLSRDGAQLTPTLAYEHPDLAAEYTVIDWTCPACSSAYSWNEPKLQSAHNTQPLCPNCATDDQLIELIVPTPEQESLSVTNTGERGEE
jgi:CRISPR/Cas system-associated exonuclease Cas4 (RecB family)